MPQGERALCSEQKLVDRDAVIDGLGQIVAGRHPSTTLRNETKSRTAKMPTPARRVRRRHPALSGAPTPGRHTSALRILSTWTASRPRVPARVVRPGGTHQPNG